MTKQLHDWLVPNHVDVNLEVNVGIVFPLSEAKARGNVRLKMEDEQRWGMEKYWYVQVNPFRRSNPLGPYKSKTNLRATRVSRWVKVGVELSQCVSQFPARLLLRQENHPLEIDRQAEAEHGLDEDADCLGIIK